MLADAVTIVRLSLHVGAAAVWVGGQFTLAGLVPVLRKDAPDAVSAAARQFARLAWPAFVVLLATGVWNMAAMNVSKQTGAWKAVLAVKVGIVVLSGVAAFMHQ